MDELTPAVKELIGSIVDHMQGVLKTAASIWRELVKTCHKARAQTITSMSYSLRFHTTSSMTRLRLPEIKIRPEVVLSRQKPHQLFPSRESSTSCRPSHSNQ